jgi:hypothetical protein
MYVNYLVYLYVTSPITSDVSNHPAERNPHFSFGHPASHRFG